MIVTVDVGCIRFKLKLDIHVAVRIRVISGKVCCCFVSPSSKLCKTCSWIMFYKLDYMSRFIS